MTLKVYKHLKGGLLVTISLLKLMMRPKSLYEKTRSVPNIPSEYTFSVGSKRSMEF